MHHANSPVIPSKKWDPRYPINYPYPGNPGFIAGGGPNDFEVTQGSQVHFAYMGKNARIKPMKNGEYQMVVNKVSGVDWYSHNPWTRSGTFSPRKYVKKWKGIYHEDYNPSYPKLFHNMGYSYSKPTGTASFQKGKKRILLSYEVEGPSYNKKKDQLKFCINPLGRSKDEITGLTKKVLKDASFSMDGSSESYQICNNYQIYSPGEIWTIYFSNVKEGDTITFWNYNTIVKDEGEYEIKNGNPVPNTFGKEIPFPNTNPPPGDQPCGPNTEIGRCYLVETLIPQSEGKGIYTSPDTKISMNNFGEPAPENCPTNNFTINYAPSGIMPWFNPSIHS